MLNNYANMSTDELWKAVLIGDEKALEDLVTRLENVIRAESRLFGRFNEDVAQDIREKLIYTVRKELGKE
jgi:ribosomal protein L13